MRQWIWVQNTQIDITFMTQIYGNMKLGIIVSLSNIIIHLKTTRFKMRDT